MSIPQVPRHSFSLPELGESASNFSKFSGEIPFLPLQKQWEELRDFFTSFNGDNFSEKSENSWQSFKKSAKKGAKICALTAGTAKTIAKLFPSINPYIGGLASSLSASKFVALFDVYNSFTTLLLFEQKDFLELASHFQRFLANFTDIVEQTNKFTLSSPILKQMCAHLWEGVLLLSIASLVSDIKGWRESAQDLKRLQEELIEKLEKIEDNNPMIRELFIQNKQRFEKYLPSEKELREVMKNQGIEVSENSISEIDRITELFNRFSNDIDKESKGELIDSLKALRGRVKSTLEKKQKETAFSIVKVVANSLLCLSGYFSLFKAFEALSLTAKSGIEIYRLLNPERKTVEEYALSAKLLGPKDGENFSGYI